MQFGMAMSAFITSAKSHTVELKLETAALFDAYAAPDEKRITPTVFYGDT